MSEHANKKEKRLALLVVAAVVIVTVLLIVETFRLLLPGLWTAFSAGDEQALSDYLTSQGQLRSCGFWPWYRCFRWSFRPCRCSWRRALPTARGWAL